MPFSRGIFPTQESNLPLSPALAGGFFTTSANLVSIIVPRPSCHSRGPGQVVLASHPTPVPRTGLVCTQRGILPGC